MKVDLSKLFDIPGAKREFSATFDFGDVLRWGSRLFGSPVQVQGRAENRSGILTVEYTADFLLETVCDRCLTALSRNEQLKFSHIVVLSLNREDNDEYIVVPDGKLDLAELAISDILLELPTSMVCDNGCRGICPICGQNRNQLACNCKSAPPDSRLDKLRELLKD